MAYTYTALYGQQNETPAELTLDAGTDEEAK